MIKTAEFSATEETDTLNPVQHVQNELDVPVQNVYHAPKRHHIISQLLRFSLVGGLNTLVDLVILNGLLWLFPTTSTLTLLAYNSLAYSLGAVNSFLLNKYWTFGQKQKTTRSELARFTLTTLFGIAWSTLILWLASLVLHPFLVNTTVWANASKVIAIAGTSLISYLGMRLWVFVRSPQKMESAAYIASQKASHEIITGHEFDPYEGSSLQIYEPSLYTAHSLSVVLPVYNEEDAIAATMKNVLDTLRTQVRDFEVIAVNDGSIDHTGHILADIAEVVPQVRVITHERNQGYGTTLADGFAAASKELTFFMDSDGQFDIRDLPRLLTFIDEYDAVIGYRIHRQDTWMRKLNAWGWKNLIWFVLGVHVRDIDCAFKLLHTDFLQQYPLETCGAMINAEMLYKLNCAGYTYREVGIQHLPRQGGRATGAKLRVIARAFRELFIYTRKWRHESKLPAQQKLIPERHHP
ncbi:MAG TPA: glycosyltransferase [Ktedonobacteraceae bacterium]|nr:glycosyltransferase [Ktedonobacteraceae bacterium]